MDHLYSLLQVARGERGASLVEYVLLLSLIALFCMAAITLLGDTLFDKTSEVGSQIG